MKFPIATAVAIALAMIAAVGSAISPLPADDGAPIRTADLTCRGSYACP